MSTPVFIKTNGRSSSVTSNPTFRDMAINTVAIVPLLSNNKQDHQTKMKDNSNFSMKSFDILMECLERYALQRVGGQDFTLTTTSSSSHNIPTIEELHTSTSSPHQQQEPHKDIHILIPNEQLTRPGDWKYDTTPLRSHAWNSGCQRMICFDGRDFTTIVDDNETTSSSYFHDASCYATDRLSKNPLYQAFADLYPCRGTSAVIGVMSIRDCISMDTLVEADKELTKWVERYTLKSFRNQMGFNFIQGYGGGGGGDQEGSATTSSIYEEKIHKVIRRIFIFDSFEEEEEDVTTASRPRQRIDLSKTTMFKSGELIAFPPIGTNMMDLHLNVVLNDLAVAIFLQLEDRIRLLCNGSGSSSSGGGGGGKNHKPSLISSSSSSQASSLSRKGSSSSIKSIHDEPVGPSEKLGISNLVNLVGSGNNTNLDGTSRIDEDDITVATYGSASGSTGVGATGVGGGIGLFSSAMKALTNSKGQESSEYLLFTPVDTKFTLDKLSSKELEYLIRRNQGRREKYAGDLCLLAGSPMDAFERYTRATELSKRDHDPLFYAASLEGCAASFVAMSDTGGHGVDEYLEENFQYPDDVMGILISNQSGVDTKLDKTKTTMPAAIFALMEEALSVVRCHIQLASIHSEMLLKMAWYISELEGSHLRCRWGEGCYEGVDTNRINQPKRWQKTSVSKLSPDGNKGLLDPLISAKYFTQCQKFCELLHKATFNGGIDLFTRSAVALRSAKLCSSGIKTVNWSGSLKGNSFSFAPFPRKSAFYAYIAAESLALSKVMNSSLSNHLWLYAFSMYSLEENMLGSSDRYGWSSIRAILLHAVIQRTKFTSAENAVLCLLNLISEISGIHLSLPANESSSLIDVGSLKNQGSLSETDVEIPDTLNKLSKKDAISRRSNPTRSRFSVQGVTSFAFLQSKWLDDEPVPVISVPFIDPSFIARLCKDELRSHPYVKDLVLSVNRLPSYPSMNCVLPFKLSECLFMSEDCTKYLEKKSSHDFESHPLKSSVALIHESPVIISSVALVLPEPHLSFERVKVDSSGKQSSYVATKAVFFNTFAKQNSTTKTALENLIAEGEERIIEIVFENRFLVSLSIQNCNLMFDCNGKYRIESIPQSFVLPPRSMHFVVKFPFSLLPSHAGEVPSASNQAGNESVTLSGLTLSYLQKSRIIQFASKAVSETRSRSLQVADPVSIYRRSAHNYKPKDKAVMNMLVETLPPQPCITLRMTSYVGNEIPNGFLIPVEMSDGEIYTVPDIQIINGPGCGKIGRLQIYTLSSSDVPDQYLYDSCSEETSSSSNGDSIIQETGKNLRRVLTSHMDEISKAQSVQLEIVNSCISLDSLNNGDDISTISCIIRVTSVGALGQYDGAIVKIRFRYKGTSHINGLEYWRKKDISFRTIKAKGPRISAVTLRPDLSWTGSYCWLGSMKKKQSDATVYHIANDGVIAVIEVVNESSSDIILTNRSGEIRSLQGGTLPPVRMSSDAIVQLPIILPRSSYSDKDKYLSLTMAQISQMTLFDWSSESVQNKNVPVKQVTRDRRGVLQLSEAVLRAIVEQRQLIGNPPVEMMVSVDHQDLLHPGDTIHVNVRVKVSGWAIHGVLPDCLISIELLCYKKDSADPFTTSNDFFWCGQNRIAQQLAKGVHSLSHEARLCFLNPGCYAVTAFTYFAKNTNCSINDRWLAKDACTIEIKDFN